MLVDHEQQEGGDAGEIEGPGIQEQPGPGDCRDGTQMKHLGGRQGRRQAEPRRQREQSVAAVMVNVLGGVN